MISELRLCVPADSAWKRHIDVKFHPPAQYFMHLINDRRQAWQTDFSGFIPLKCAYLRKVIPQEVLPKLRQSLVDDGTIHWRKKYAPGRQSMGFKLTSRFRKSKIVVCRDSLLIRRVNRLRIAKEFRLLPVHLWLKEKLSALVLDTDRARRIIGELIPKSDSTLDVDEYRQILYDQITVFADQLSTGEIPLSCDKYGRVHSPLTRFPKALRCCLSTERGELGGIDLANSQPLFAGMVARKYDNSSRQSRLKLRNWKPPTVPYGPSPVAPLSNTMSKSTQFVDNQGCCDIRSRGHYDVNEFIDLCESGLFYEELIPAGMERSVFKRQVFRDLFFGRDRCSSKIRDVFTSRFPTVAKVISELKSNNYRRMAWLMQHEESKLFIGKICRTLMRERPSMPLFTIHDSLVTTEPHLDFIRRIAIDEFYALGVTPSFKTETWTD
jgi:hypothetical protein